MPRKPTLKKKTVTVVVNGKPVAVTLHPPTGSRRSWYAYWAGLIASKSTGCVKLEDAMVVVESMVKNGGTKVVVADAVLSDEEFKEIQRVHFNRKQDERARQRAQKTLQSCLDALAAFREITGLSPIAKATPDDCARFQRVALALPKLWRIKPVSERRPVEFYCDEEREKRRLARSRDDSDDCPRYSANNVLKWSRTLQAAWERCNRNALKRKCVRGVVAEAKLLASNPWTEFTWISGTDRPIRHFDPADLVAFLDYFEATWPGLAVPALLAKTYFWSWGRRAEVAALQWSDLQISPNEYHFDTTGKWGVRKWFRIPAGLHEELQKIRTDSPYVFAAYPDQLRLFYEETGQQDKARKVRRDFDPKNVANWLYKKLKAWSRSAPKGHFTLHHFRKTALQFARRGEDLNQRVAADARLSPTVMMANYVQETDNEMRERSNRTFGRIVASLPADVGQRYGHVEQASSSLQEQLHAAIATENWGLVAALSSRLAKKNQPVVG